MITKTEREIERKINNNWPSVLLKAKSKDFTAPCGCNLGFDGDGFVRLHFCNTHGSSEKERTALVSVVAHAKRYRAAEVAFNRSPTLANKQEVSNYGHDFDLSVKNLALSRRTQLAN